MFDLNNTEIVFAEPNVAQVSAFSIALSLIFTFSLMFNILSIASIITVKAFTPINILIINLGLADMTYSFGIPFFIIQLYDHTLPFGSFGCKVFLFTEFSGITVGVLTIAALSVERFIDVTEQNSKFESLSNNLKSSLLVVYSIIIWVLATCFTLPIVISIKLVTHGEISICQSDWHDSTLRIFFIAKFLTFFIIPYSVIIASSSKLLLFLNEWKKRFNRMNNKNKGRIIIDQKSLVKLKIRNQIEKSSDSTTIQTELFSLRSDLINEKTSILEKKTRRERVRNYFNSNFVSRQFLLENRQEEAVFKGKKDGFVNVVRRKAIRLVLSIIFLFLIQWLPFWIFQIFVLFSTDYYFCLQLIHLTVTTLSYSNTVVNPVLYMLLTYNFKEYCKKSWLKILNF